MISVYETFHKLVRGRTARGAIGSLGLRISGAVLNAGLMLVLTRSLGAAGYGAYAFAVAAVIFLSIPALLGFDKLLIREIPSALQRRAFGEVRGLLRASDLVVGIASLLIVAAAATGMLVFGDELQPVMVSAFYISLFALPFFAYARLRQSASKGLQHVVEAQVPEFLIQPVVLSILILCCAWFSDSHFLATTAVWLYVTTVASVMIVGIIIRNRALPEGILNERPLYRSQYWVKSMWSFTLFSGMVVVSREMSILLVGFIAGSEETGIFQLALRLAGFISFPLLAVNAPLTPAFSHLYAVKDMVGIKRKAVLGARYAFGLSFIPGMILIVFGDSLLALFGEEFRAAYPSLVLIVVAFLISAASGPVGGLLMMTNYEKDSTRAIILGTLIALFLNFTLIPLNGGLGAAIAVAASSILTNMLNVGQVYMRHGIFVTALGRLGPG